MNPLSKRLIALASAIYLCGTLTAQTDSSLLDLGRVRIKKEFTQHITIKSEDLARMPFTNLGEALAAWLYGANTGKAGLVYVVDGNPVTDVNAYSIYDIEEITLVQNAMVQLNGADRQQQLVLITTGRKKRTGITVASQTFLVNRDYEKVKPGVTSGSSTNFYHQYHIAANGKTGQWQYGASANYLRDVMPVSKEPSLKYGTPPNFDRFRFNGWLDLPLGKNNSLSFQLNYTPQTLDADATTNDGTGISNTDLNQKESILSSWIRLQSRVWKKFSNELTINVASSHNRSNTDQLVNTGNPIFPYQKQEHSRTRGDYWVVRDHLTFTQPLGSWTLEPSLNATFRSAKSRFTYNRSEGDNTSPPVLTYFETRSKGEAYFLTPAVSLYYKNIFHVQAGVLTNLSRDYGKKFKKEYPFASLSADIVRLVNPQSSINLKIFGSWAQADHFRYDAPALSDFYTPVAPAPMFYMSPWPVNYYPGRADSSYWIWETGASLGLLQDRLQIGYNFEKRDFTREFITQLPSTGGLPVYLVEFPELLSTAHHVRITGRIVDRKNIQWRSGITLSGIDTKIGKLSLGGTPVTPYTPPRSWTGGWNNQLNVQRFTAGVTLLYHFNEQFMTAFGLTEKLNSLLLQQLYIGYRVNLPKVKALEIYASTRNLVQPAKSQLSDYRRYYGLGVNMSL